MAHRVRHDLLLSDARIDDPGDKKTIQIKQWGQVCLLTSSASAETRTLARPTKVGTRGTVFLEVDGGGDITLTVTGGYNQAGDTTITLADAGDYVTFESVEVGTTKRWQIMSDEGTDVARTLADVTGTKLKLAVTTVEAGGTAISNATALSAGLNVVNNTDNTAAVILPVAEAGLIVAVKGAVNAKSLPVFPQSGSSIDASNTNASVTLGAAALGAGGLFIASTTTKWRHFPIDVT